MIDNFDFEFSQKLKSDMIRKSSSVSSSFAVLLAETGVDFAAVLSQCATAALHRLERSA